METGTNFVVDAHADSSSATPKVETRHAQVETRHALNCELLLKLEAEDAKVESAAPFVLSDWHRRRFPKLLQKRPTAPTFTHLAAIVGAFGNSPHMGYLRSDIEALIGRDSCPSKQELYGMWLKVPGTKYRCLIPEAVGLAVAILENRVRY